MTYRIVIYCPDRHIEFDGLTPDTRGVGGGITSRTRLASALARRGNEVVVVCNCSTVKRVDGVTYQPLDSATELRGQVLIANTSGGSYDLSALKDFPTRVGLKVLWVSGVAEPKGLSLFTPDVIVAKSNFLRRAIRDRWSNANPPIVVIYNGYPAELFPKVVTLQRKDPFRLAYISHPAKGLDEAIQILRKLRSEDARYSMKVLGSEALWGEAENVRTDLEGVSFLGTVGQPIVVEELLQATYSICLQEIEEGFGLAVLESLRAGCVVIASAVGAYGELVVDQRNGILVQDYYQSESALNRAVREIRHLTANERERSALQSIASMVPWSWDLIAQAWEQLMGQWLESADAPSHATRKAPCSECGSDWVEFADGSRCLHCGAYRHDGYLRAIDPNLSLVGPMEHKD